MMRETHTPPRSIRVPDEVWLTAKAEAQRRGETAEDTRFERAVGLVITAAAVVAFLTGAPAGSGPAFF